MSTAVAERINAFAGTLPQAAKDIKLNLKNLFKPSALSPQQAYGTALACAYNEGDRELATAIHEDGAATGALTEETVEDAKAAAALMSMNNVYYRFRHMIGKEIYSQLPARLRMQRLMKPVTDKATFELFSIAVSAINGCEMCIRSHEKVLTQHGVSEEAIHEAVRIAAIVRATAVSSRLA